VVKDIVIPMDNPTAVSIDADGAMAMIGRLTVENTLLKERIIALVKLIPKPTPEKIAEEMLREAVPTSPNGSAKA